MLWSRFLEWSEINCAEKGCPNLSLHIKYECRTKCPFPICCKPGLAGVCRCRILGYANKQSYLVTDLVAGRSTNQPTFVTQLLASSAASLLAKKVYSYSYRNPVCRRHPHPHPHPHTHTFLPVGCLKSRCPSQPTCIITAKPGHRFETSTDSRGSTTNVRPPRKFSSRGDDISSRSYGVSQPVCPVSILPFITFSKFIFCQTSLIHRIRPLRSTGQFCQVSPITWLFRVITWQLRQHIVNNLWTSRESECGR